MKKVFVFITATLFCCVHSIAQAPNSLPYQGVARTASGGLVSSKNISLKFSIHNATPTGTIQFQETHNTTTSAQGLFSVNIGQGTATIFNLDSVTWSSGGKFLQVEMDVNGGSSFIDMGTTQFGSVPYALYAANSSSSHWGKVGNEIYNNNTGNVAIKSGSKFGIGVLSPINTLDVRGNGVDDAALLSVGNADNSHQLVLFGARQNDPNPYIAWNASDALRFASYADGFSERMRIDSNGNVGVGTSTPNYKLHVVGKTNIQDSLVVGSDFSGGGRMVIANNNNTFSNPIGTRLFMHSGVQYSAMGGGTFPLYSTVDIDCGDIDYNFTPVDTFIDGATMHLREPGFRGVVNNRWALLTHGSIKVNGSQNVSNDFTVGGAFKLTSGNFGNGKILTSDSFGVASWQESAGLSNWNVNGNDISNKNSGNVGIGTATPIAPLDIQGITRLSNTSLQIKGHSNWDVVSIGNDQNDGYLSMTDGTGLQTVYLNSWPNRKSYLLNNLGLGTTTPTEKLEVAGNIKATGTINALKPVVNSIPSFLIETKHNNALVYENHSLILDGSLPAGFSCDIIYYSNFAGTLTCSASIMYQQGSLTPVNSIAINQGAHIRVMVLDATHYFVTVMQ